MVQKSSKKGLRNGPRVHLGTGRLPRAIQAPPGRLLKGLTGGPRRRQEGPKRAPRGREKKETLQEGHQERQEPPKTPQDQKWSQVRANIELRWVLKLKTVTSPKLVKETIRFQVIYKVLGHQNWLKLEAALKRTETLPRRS